MSPKKQKQLKKIIKRMRKIQKSIANDDQPVSALQIEELKQLGEKYAKVIRKLDQQAGLVSNDE
jgi:hypothetical protein